MIKLHLHFVLEWVNLICTCQPSNALQHYVMATNTFCLNFFTHRAGPHVCIPTMNILYGLEQHDCFQMPTLRLQHWVFSTQDVFMICAGYIYVHVIQTC